MKMKERANEVSEQTLFDERRNENKMHDKRDETTEKKKNYKLSRSNQKNQKEFMLLFMEKCE
jgi:hypothetical protein